MQRDILTYTVEQLLLVQLHLKVFLASGHSVYSCRRYMCWEHSILSLMVTMGSSLDKEAWLCQLPRFIPSAENQSMHDAQSHCLEAWIRWQQKGRNQRNLPHTWWKGPPHRNNPIKPYGIFNGIHLGDLCKKVLLLKYSQENDSNFTLLMRRECLTSFFPKCCFMITI